MVLIWYLKKKDVGKEKVKTNIKNCVGSCTKSDRVHSMLVFSRKVLAFKVTGIIITRSTSTNTFFYSWKIDEMCVFAFNN